MRVKYYYIYILTNKSATLYIGVTNDLKRRLWEHVHETIEGFTKRYHINKLIYYEIYQDIDLVLNREKELKGWRRSKKMALIKTMNPNFDELEI